MSTRPLAGEDGDELGDELGPAPAGPAQAATASSTLPSREIGLFTGQA